MPNLDQVNQEYARKILKRVQNDAIDTLKTIFLYDTLIVVGAEIEFYAVSIDIEDLTKNVNLFAERENIPICSIDIEHGPCQYEISLGPYDSAATLGDDIIRLKEFLSTTYNTDFTPKPAVNLPGSGMHFHISIYDEYGVNLFAKSFDNMVFSEIFYYAVGGMLDMMSESMLAFAPTDNCYERMKYLNKSGDHKYYPVNCSWGINNRTCAIRIPSCANSNANTRIEHRVSSSTADPYLCMICIIHAMSYGIVHKIWPHDPIFGDAFDVQYRYLRALPKDLKNAVELFECGRMKEVL